MGTMRNVVVGLFAIAGALSPLACSGQDGDGVGEGAAAQDQALLQEGSCISEYMGGATSCKPADVWKKYAYDACASRGLDLTELNFGSTCSGGFTEAKYSCCKPAPKPVPPKPGPEPVACFADAQGGPTSCKPAEVWKQYASDACKAKGTSLVQIAYADECAKGSFRYTKYECCDATKPPPPPPPPPVCKTDVLGDATSCKPDGTWKEYAFNHCVDQKLAFSAMGLGPSCGAGMSTSVKVTCCEAEPPPPPPPPPPPSCDWRSLGDPTSCKDPGTWKQYAYESCLKDGLKLADIGFPSTTCDASGSTSYVKFSCCK
jgi:hypothetical protein